ncbi:unnamed protein product, partial [marine sediment metagenome]
ALEAPETKEKAEGKNQEKEERVIVSVGQGNGMD